MDESMKSKIQMVLNKYTLNAVSKAFSDFGSSVGKDRTISYNEAVQALQYTIEKLKDFPIQF